MRLWVDPPVTSSAHSGSEKPEKCEHDVDFPCWDCNPHLHPCVDCGEPIGGDPEVMVYCAPCLMRKLEVFA